LKTKLISFLLYYFNQRKYDEKKNTFLFIYESIYKDNNKIDREICSKPFVYVLLM